MFHRRERRSPHQSDHRKSLKLMLIGQAMARPFIAARPLPADAQCGGRCAAFETND